MFLRSSVGCCFLWRTLNCWFKFHQKSSVASKHFLVFSFQVAGFSNGNKSNARTQRMRQTCVKRILKTFFKNRKMCFLKAVNLAASAEEQFFKQLF
jgi:hypothetical protein